MPHTNRPPCQRQSHQYSLNLWLQSHTRAPKPPLATSTRKWMHAQMYARMCLHGVTNKWATRAEIME